MEFYQWETIKPPCKGLKWPVEILEDEDQLADWARRAVAITT